MNLITTCRRLLISSLALAALVGGAGPAPAQDGTLMHNPMLSASAEEIDQTTRMTLQTSSFMYQPLSPEARSRDLKVEDIITVLVDYRANVASEADAQSRKTANINAQLQEWIGFDGKSIFRGPQSRGDPAIQGQWNSVYRAQGDLNQQDSMTFRIGAKIVDIRPNGNLVIEAHRTIESNDEVWDTSLTGEVSRQSIGPDRVVRSDAITDLRIHKKEQGQVRNSYAPGWLGWWWSRFHAI